MDPNPYASPVAQPADEIQWSLGVQLAFILGLFLIFETLPYIFGGGIYGIPANHHTPVKLLLSESAVSAILGIASFTTLTHRRKPAKLMYLGRAVCIAQLVVTGAMLPMLLRLRWTVQYTYILPTILTFACVDVIVLHFSLRRFEQYSRPANWTLCALLIVDAGIIIIAVHFKSYIERSIKALFVWDKSFEIGQALICLLLAWRVFEVHRTWRSEAQPGGRERAAR